MRTHQAVSAASSVREKWTRPLVVGPSPVITPSRTTASARAAVSLQEILEGSMVARVSAAIANGAGIGTYSSSFFFWAGGPIPAFASRPTGVFCESWHRRDHRQVHRVQA